MAVHLFYCHRLSCKRQETKRLILTDFLMGLGYFRLVIVKRQWKIASKLKAMQFNT